jgi:toxin-antitoxin system PIN domain toxin
MSRHVPDVNVLLALVWPRHQSHAKAHEWFAEVGHRAWATTPLTTLGVLRLLSNLTITQGVVRPETALDLVARLRLHDGHEHWPWNEDLATIPRGLAARIQGHQQWTDAALLWHVASRSSVLVTFDSGLKTLAGKEWSKSLLLLS